MSPYFSLCKKAMIRSKEFEFYYKQDASHGAILKIAEKAIPANRIYVPLDVAIELCERLELLEQLYQEFRPLPENGQLGYQEIVEAESTYKLELSVRRYRQNLLITQSKKRLTRGPPDNINIPDMSDFRRELAELVEHLSTNCLELLVETDESGLSRMVRGNRVAVIYCPVRPWPWTHSYQRQQLLLDPQLVGLILVDRNVDRIRHYCERVYPDLMLDTYVDMDYDHDEWSVFYENLKVRWIRRGQQFRINERPGTLSLKHEDQWFTA
ncbi:hypothetical protein GHT06_009394 [Daphnia sinensis]|uniref:Uncharacterized protein n=1 Tax=Daphnia sinensis TaxID=1820382 RepID=A0AAD5L3Z4_9CRUS|nr:hypothetical protein GHT06_009394 [Daphnia sinensis]